MRIGSLTFTGREFWTSLARVAARAEYVSIPAERGFRGWKGTLPNVLVPQALTWAARGLFLGTVAGLGLYAAHLTPLDVYGVKGSLILASLMTVASRFEPYVNATAGWTWFRPIRRLLMVTPTWRGLLNTGRVPAVMEQRTDVLAKNMVQALAQHPDVSTVQIVTESDVEIPAVDASIRRHLHRLDRRERMGGPAVAAAAAPPAGPVRARLKSVNMNHAPTRELIERLQTTFAPKLFRSADEFVAYFRPENVPGWAEAKHDPVYQQLVAIYLFDSLRWSLPQFFALGGTEDQIRRLLALPSGAFDRGLLRPGPSWNVVYGTLLTVITEAERRDGHPGPTPALVRSRAAMLRPAPAVFTALDANRPQINHEPVRPDVQPIANDGW